MIAQQVVEHARHRVVAASVAAPANDPRPEATQDPAERRRRLPPRPAGWGSDTTATVSTQVAMAEHHQLQKFDTKRGRTRPGGG